MDKNDVQILVAPTEAVFSDHYFQGFSSRDDIDYEARILASHKAMRRGDAEKDPSHKQPIGYAIIINPVKKLVYAYQRASSGNYDENRLEGKWSWGVGGHIDAHEGAEENPIHTSLLRELEEEITIKGSTKPQVLGYINDDSNDVGKVHFGILYAILTDATEAFPNDAESSHGSMRPYSFLKELQNNPDAEVENWSAIAMEPLKTLLNL